VLHRFGVALFFQPVLRKSMHHNKHSISPKAFWDIAFEALDFEKYSLYVMEKVFNYGSWQDQIAVLKYYGTERVKNEIIHAKYLRKPALSYLCAVLDLQQENFTCYKRMQLQPQPWLY
jgi:hypothetical protein